MQSINSHIMRTKSPVDMEQTALERELHKLLLLKKQNKTTTNFDLCQVTPGFAMPPFIFYSIPLATSIISIDPREYTFFS